MEALLKKLPLDGTVDINKSPTGSAWLLPLPFVDLKRPLETWRAKQVAKWGKYFLSNPTVSKKKKEANKAM